MFGLIARQNRAIEKLVVGNSQVIFYLQSFEQKWLTDNNSDNQQLKGITSSKGGYKEQGAVLVCLAAASQQK